MTKVSPRTIQVIESFARSMGLGAKQAPDGSFSFVFSESGALSITGTDDGDRLIVSLERASARQDSELEWRLLSRAGLEPSSQTFLYSAMASDGGMVFAVDLAENEIDLVSLNAALQRLMDAHESLY